MRLAGAAESARLRRAGAGRLGAAGAGGKDGKLFRQFGRTATRAGRSGPIAGTHQDFAILIAFLAMKFVYRHGRKIAARGKNSSDNGSIGKPAQRKTATIHANSFRSDKLRLAA